MSEPSIGPRTAALAAAEAAALAAALAATEAAALGAELAAVDGAELAVEPVHAPTATTAAAANARNLLVSMVRTLLQVSGPVRDGELVLPLPHEPDSLALLRERLGRGR